jgi:hypothetical protein
MISPLWMVLHPQTVWSDKPASELVKFQKMTKEEKILAIAGILAILFLLLVDLTAVKPP